MQYSGNIRWVFPQRCNVPGILGTFREYVEAKYFLANSQWKSRCLLKVCDLTITNLDLLENSSNHKAIFPEYKENIPQIFVSKMLQGYPRKIARLWKHFYEAKKFRKLLYGLSCENFNIGSLLSCSVFWTVLKLFFI